MGLFNNPTDKPTMRAIEVPPERINIEDLRARQRRLARENPELHMWLRYFTLGEQDDADGSGDSDAS